MAAAGGVIDEQLRALPDRWEGMHPALASIRTAASVALDLVGSVLAPPRCAACDEPTPRLAAFCPSCASTVERATSRPGDADLAAFVYCGAIAGAITRFKYERRPDLARPLGDLLWAASNARARGPLVVVPVPLHPVRLADRGYNQSALLAARVASRIEAPLAARALRRVRDTPRQATLGRADRFANVDGAFEVRDPRAVGGRAVLLVDDVRTTGSTLRACASVLLRSGARSVCTWVVARAE